MKKLITDIVIVSIWGGIFAFIISGLNLAKRAADGFSVTYRDIICVILDGIWGIIFCGAAYISIQYLEPVTDPDKMKMIELLCCGFFAGANNSLRQILYKLWLHLLYNPKKFIEDCKEVIKR